MVKLKVFEGTECREFEWDNLTDLLKERGFEDKDVTNSTIKGTVQEVRVWTPHNLEELQAQAKQDSFDIKEEKPAPRPDVVLQDGKMTIDGHESVNLNKKPEAPKSDTSDETLDLKALQDRYKELYQKGIAVSKLKDVARLKDMVAKKEAELQAEADAKAKADAEAKAQADADALNNPPVTDPVTDPGTGTADWDPDEEVVQVGWETDPVTTPEGEPQTPTDEWTQVDPEATGEPTTGEPANGEPATNPTE